MQSVQKIFRDHPNPASDAGEQALQLVHDAAECAAACSACADACLAEDGVAELRMCIRLCLDCADICSVTGRLLARAGRQDEETLRRQLLACEAACAACAEMCAGHDGMPHCRACAEVCRRCTEACRRMREALVA